MLPAELATFSEENQAEVEKVQELVMAVEEREPSLKALSGVMVWSAKRQFWLIAVLHKARICSIKMIGLQQF